MTNVYKKQSIRSNAEFSQEDDRIGFILKHQTNSFLNEKSINFFEKIKKQYHSFFGASVSI